VTDASRGGDSVDESLTLSGTIAGRHARPNYESAWPIAGVALSRYVLRRRLGYGGMGEVWAAWDGQLAREVAIKVVRLRDAKSASVHAERLAREARALARVSDPHVVQVYDVGSYDTATDTGERMHGVFVVMELVRGLTLSEWLSAARRSTTDVVRLFIAAGRGLATAHAAGLVHRDIKPSNMFVGDDGRVRIGDFGLARATPSSGSGFATASWLAVDASVVASDETLSGSLTDTGTVVGTPLYMAPEQHGGVVVDARGDQYAFCVAMYEALYRVRPFVGGLEAIARAKWSRKLTPPMIECVPAAVHEAVWRGLAPTIAERWPTMNDLVAALERAIRPRPRMTWPLAAAGGVVVAGLVAATLPGSDDERCAPIGAGLWTESRRLGLAEHGTTAKLVGDAVRSIDGLQAELCSDSADAHLAELQCLRRAARDIDGILAVLEEPGRTPDLAGLLEGLPDVEACRSATAQSELPVADRDRHLIEAELRRLARGEVLWRADRHHEALAVAESVLLAVDAGRVPEVPVRARAQLLVGKALDGLDSGDAAQKALVDAYFAGSASGDAETAFEASRILCMAHAERQRPRDAQMWLRHAEVELAKLVPTPVLVARITNARAGVYMFSNELDRAVAEFRSGLEQCSIEDCLSGISLTMNLAAVLWRLGEHAESEALRRKALAAIEARYGADSPASVLLRLDLVHSLLQTGRIDEADELLTVAEGLVERWLDPMHRYRALAADQRAEILLIRGDPGGAVVLLEHSFSIVDRTYGADDLRRVSRLSDLAYAYFVSGRGEEALATFARARELTERVDGESFEHGSLLITAGHVRGELGDYEGALADLREARRVLEPLYGGDHPTLVQCDMNEARVLMLANRSAEALPIFEAAAAREKDARAGNRAPIEADLALADCLIELGQSARALAVLDRHAGATLEVPLHGPILDFARARAIVATDRARALALARSALIAVRNHDVDATDIEAWIAKHDTAP
jgi:serine/threonine protein kinase/tetratricopeptide (TPR) repeat protein